MQGLIGRKIGMTQIYDSDGCRVPVTVIQAGSCVVVQRKTKARDGYDAVQLGFGPAKASRLSRPELGRLKKAEISPCMHFREFAVEADDDPKVGDEITAALFENVSHVDVTGVSKGRGFSGLLKRHRMGGGFMTHGGHSKRRVGSIGQCAYPGTVAKGKKMPGHFGNATRTQQNLKVAQVRAEDNLLLVRGAVPGPCGGLVLVKKARKKKGGQS